MEALAVLALLAAWMLASILWGLCFSEAARERREKDASERDAARRRRRERVLEE